ncbi:MAG: orotidine-5'-phosphate decarboxylase [Candidatus Aminicenantes bacterium]|nr:orotidine-5'-phosphate decarboxylase [Candidatus Aminicenantes bacterium]MCK5003738.1 orotidine-5'-phosphate decarboxylase [Candidatus Aminicenantes bacterium]
MRDKIIVALDFDRFEVAESFVETLKEAVFYKVGLQAFMRYGPRILKLLKDRKKNVFLDLKFKDIPNTVFWAVKSSMLFDPRFVSIHLSGGKEMMKKAVLAAQDSADTKILGVSVLTSFLNEDLIETGVNLNTEDAVIKLCRLGIESGLDSFVCSPLEIKPLKEKLGSNITLVTPGIRPHWAAKGDQKRVFTPRMAIEAGADYLVIGRPITASKDPNGAFTVILNEITG